MKAISGELLVTWQADILTRLVEVIYERHGWRMPGEVLVSDKYSLDRDTLSKIYVMAARKIKKETIMKKAVGLSEQYYLALQRYSEVASPSFQQADPFTDPQPNAKERWSIYAARISSGRNLASRGGWSRKSRPGQRCTVSGHGCFPYAIVELFRRALRCSEAATR